MDEAEKVALQNRYLGGAIALKGMWDSLAHIQVFVLPTLWEEGSTELDAVHDAIEGVKGLLAQKVEQIEDAAERLANGDSDS